MMRLIKTLVAVTIICFGVALPQIGRCQTALSPVLLVLPSPAPADQPLGAIVYLYANSYANAFTNSQPIVSGNGITLTFDTSCFNGACLPANQGYLAFFAPLPALAAGDYALRVQRTGIADALQFPMSVGSAMSDPPVQLATFPAQPKADQAFTVNAYFRIHTPFYFYSFDAVSVSGNTITAPMRLVVSCPFECPPSTGYGPYRIDLPGLAAGNYTLKIVDAVTPSTILAQIPLGVVGANPDPAPALEPWGLLLLLASIALAALGNPRLQRVRANHYASESGNNHG